MRRWADMEEGAAAAFASNESINAFSIFKWRLFKMIFICYHWSVMIGCDSLRWRDSLCCRPWWNFLPLPSEINNSSHCLCPIPKATSCHGHSGPCCGLPANLSRPGHAHNTRIHGGTAVKNKPAAEAIFCEVELLLRTLPASPGSRSATGTCPLCKRWGGGSDTGRGCSANWARDRSLSAAWRTTTVWTSFFFFFPTNCPTLNIDAFRC